MSSKEHLNSDPLISTSCLLHLLLKGVSSLFWFITGVVHQNLDLSWLKRCCLSQKNIAASPFATSMEGLRGTTKNRKSATKKKLIHEFFSILFQFGRQRMSYFGLQTQMCWSSSWRICIGLTETQTFGSKLEFLRRLLLATLMWTQSTVALMTYFRVRSLASMPWRLFSLFSSIQRKGKTETIFIAKEVYHISRSIC